MLPLALALLSPTFETSIPLLKVMSYNIWVGGTRSQPLSQTVQVIKTSGAQIVGIQEPAENLPTIARSLGWNVSAQASIVTSFEILEEWKVDQNRWGGVRLKLPTGQEVLVYNDHFNPYPYGPYEVRDGKATTQSAVLKVESDAGRTRQMTRILHDLSRRREQRLPVLLVGDFNAPSHLDWVESTRDRNFGMTVEWSVSKLAETAGFRDPFREIHPDPAMKPGFTWSPGYPVPNVEPNDVMDRIDFVLYRGDLKVKNAQIVGETGPHTDIAVDPWPSDHRAVLVTFAMPK